MTHPDDVDIDNIFDALDAIDALSRWKEKLVSSPDFKNPIVAEVRDLMTTRGVSQSELARRTGIAQARISRLLNGKETGSLKTWRRLEKAITAVHEEETTDDQRDK